MGKLDKAKLRHQHMGNSNIASPDGICALNSLANLYVHTCLLLGTRTTKYVVCNISLIIWIRKKTLLLTVHCNSRADSKRHPQLF